MIENSFYTWAVPLGRTAAGFVLGVMLGIIGGWLAVVFNAMVGFPWEMEVHRTIYLVGVGVGAGIGAYLGWMNLMLRWHFVAGSLLIVLLAGIAGTYVGLVLGQNISPSHLGRQYTIDNALHLGAATAAIFVSTVLGLIHEVRSGGR